MNILYVGADFEHEKNCTIHNCDRPALAINNSGLGHKASVIHFMDFIKNDENTQKIVSESDIIIVERNLFQDVLTLMQFWKVRDKTIMCIFDDGYHCMHKKNPTYKFWHDGKISFQDAQGKEQEGIMKPHPLEQMKWGLEMSVGLQTVSNAIADYWKPNTDTYVIHNNIFLEKYLKAESLNKHPDNIFIGWTGSLSHLDSFESSGLLRAFRKICNLYPKVRILISGDKKIYDLVDVPSHKKFFQPFVPEENYPSLVKTMDIYTIPLAGEYDKCRSQIKALESLACKIPTIATDFPNYAHMRDYMHVTENGWQNWVEAISKAIDNISEYREHAAEVGFKYAESQDYSLHVQERIDLYQHVIEKGYKREQI